MRAGGSANRCPELVPHFGHGLREVDADASVVDDAVVHLEVRVLAVAGVLEDDEGVLGGGRLVSSGLLLREACSLRTCLERVPQELLQPLQCSTSINGLLARKSASCNRSPLSRTWPSSRMEGDWRGVGAQDTCSGLRADDAGAEGPRGSSQLRWHNLFLGKPRNALRPLLTCCRGRGPAGSRRSSSRGRSRSS